MLTVRQVMERPAFRTARVLAGAAGLDRVVRWVHVGEIPNLAEFLQGGELVLTTGVGLREPAARRQFVDGLVAAQAAGLVLELGSYFPAAPDDLVEAAEAACLPLIVFPQAVRFLTLTQDVNTHILNAHYRFLQDLEELSQELRRALLETEGVGALLAILARTVDAPVLYLPRDPEERPLAAGPWPDVVVGPFQDIVWSPDGRADPLPHVRQTVMVFGQPMGDLLVAPPATALVDERLYLATDRTATALAQEFIRQYALDRRQRDYDAQRLEPLLGDSAGALDAAHKLVTLYRIGERARSLMWVMVDATELTAADQLRRKLLGQGAVACLVLHQASVATLAVVGTSSWLADMPPRLDAWARSAGVRLGLSTVVHTAQRVVEAVQEAEDALNFRQHLATAGASTYGELGLYRWILATPPPVLKRTLLPELEPVLAHDRTGHPTLLETLVALLEHPDDKSKAAEELGIHRQTLYNRMKALEQLLGPTYMLPERRTTLYAAWLALKLYPDL
jgi:purine catabolism regulator